MLQIISFRSETGAAKHKDSTVSIEIQSILNQNITIVFDSLDLHDFSSSELKTLMGKETRATVMDTPEMIVAIYPPAPTIIQVGDRRVRINMPQNTTELGQVPLWDLAIASASFVPPESNPIAYGFNYDIGATVDEVDVNDLLIQRFVRSPETLNRKLEGTLTSIVPRFRFVRGEVRYDLVLEPVNAERLKIHLNVHFELSGGDLPTGEGLHQAYETEYSRFVEMLPELLNA